MRYLILLFLLAGCVPTGKIEPHELRAAQEFCEDHGGLDEIELNHIAFASKKVHCNDGFSGRHLRTIRQPVPS